MLAHVQMHLQDHDWKDCYCDCGYLIGGSFYDDVASEEEQTPRSWKLESQGWGGR